MTTQTKHTKRQAHREHEHLVAKALDLDLDVRGESTEQLRELIKHSASCPASPSKRR